jgi:hypothetical protein
MSDKQADREGQDVISNMREGVSLFERGDYSAAEKRFRQVLLSEPRNQEALNNLGVIAFQRRDLGQAAQFLTQALEIDPYYVDGVVNLCAVLRVTGNLGKALPLVELITTRYPDDQKLQKLQEEVRQARAEAKARTTRYSNGVAANSIGNVPFAGSKAKDQPHRQEGEVELRRFPYPYRAAFTIANDIDLSNWRCFVDIYTFLCSTRTNVIGKGLGLPLSSSFFLFNLSEKDQFAYFADTDCKDGPQRESIDYLIRAGYLDNIHGFGSFTSSRPFRREFAQRAYEVLLNRGLAVPIWSSHGDESSTAQIDSSGQVPDAKGDDPDAEEYHFDLTREFGVRYIWQWHDGGVTDIIGQSAADYVTYGDKIFLPRAVAGRKEYSSLARTAENRKLLAGENNLLVPVVLKDGSKTYNIRRFSGGLEKANASTLAQQIAPTYLTELVQNNAYMVLYQHLAGCRRSAADPPVVNRPPYFSDETLAGLLTISEMYREGHLWVAPLAWLLDYAHTQEHLCWTYANVDGNYKIVIDSITDQFLGREREPDPADLAGVTFYTPDPVHTEVWVGDRRIEIDRYDEPDYTGRHAVSIPLRRMASFDVE